MTRPADVDPWSFMLGRLEALEWAEALLSVRAKADAQHIIHGALEDARAQAAALEGDTPSDTLPPQPRG